MNIENLTTIEDLDNFIQGNQTIVFTVLGDKDERYYFIQKTLIKFRYITLKKSDKGVVNKYLRKVTGYSRQQLTRLIEQYKDVGRIKWRPCRRNGFSTTYDKNDIKLLVEMDTRHEDICGHAIKKLCERAYNKFDQKEYQTLAKYRFLICTTSRSLLAESKNASIVRKQFGYQHITKKWAPLMNEFNLIYLYPYINYHRPCFSPEIITDEKGKQRKNILIKT